MARYYNPQNGNFLSLDPDPGDDDDPISQNGYTYANNNPVVLIDPSGRTNEMDWRNQEKAIKGTRNLIGKAASGSGSKRVSSGRWKVGDDVYKPTSKGKAPKWSTVRSRFWKNEAARTDAADIYGKWNIGRMKKGLAPQRWNDKKFGMESMELSHEPIPQRCGGKEFVPRWPEDHAKYDFYRRPGY